jgi:hypothetical protein
MWESRRDFQRVWEGWEAGFMAFQAFHTLSFPWPASRPGATGLAALSTSAMDSARKEVFVVIVKMNALTNGCWNTQCWRRPMRFIACEGPTAILGLSGMLSPDSGPFRGKRALYQPRNLPFIDESDRRQAHLPVHTQAA